MLEAKNIYYVAENERYLVAKDVYVASYTLANGKIKYFFIEPFAWESFIKRHPEYTDEDFSNCLFSGIAPGTMKLSSHTIYVFEAT